MRILVNAAVFVLLIGLITPVTAGPIEDANDAMSAFGRPDDLRRLADQGNALAAYYLGEVYQDGQGVPQDYAAAIKWYRLAANKGIAAAQSSMGRMYFFGQGVTQSYVEAINWYRPAADKGDDVAQSTLGLMYANGQGVPQAYAAAIKWYRLAAGKEEPNAQNNLGGMYFNGQGVKQDFVQAHMWFNLAAANSRASAENRKSYVSNRDMVASRMTSRQIADAQKLAREWVSDDFRKSSEEGERLFNEEALRLKNPGPPKPKRK